MANKDTEHRGEERGDRARRDPTRGSREDTERAVLELSGERGYANLTIAGLLARSGSDRSRFYSTWSGKEECFVSAHSAAADDLAARLLAAGAAGRDWGTGVEAALLELEGFTSENPALAAGLIGEAHVVGGGALEKRGEAFARLARRLEKGREQDGGHGGADRPATAMVVLSAIEAIVIRTLAGHGRVADDLPDLLFLTLVYYRGATEARRAAVRLAAALRS